MSVLIEREVHAQMEELGLEPVQVCRDAQRGFFKEHLGWWLPAFGTVLTRRAGTGFYAALGNFLRAFVPAERAFFDLPPFDALASPDPTSTDQVDMDEGSCHSCTAFAACTAFDAALDRTTPPE